MRRWFVVLVVLAVISAACAGDSGGPPSTEAPTTSGVPVPTSGLVGPSTTVPAETSTTIVAPAWPAVEVLVTNDDGVFLIDTEGEISQLVKGRVAYAVDDTRGGLLFQVERGRSTNWGGGAPHVQDSRVWWVPQGSGKAVELLVPTTGLPLDLTLVDAVGIDGVVLVAYVRHDSTMDPEYGPHSWRDSLRVFDLDTQVVTEVFDFPAYEHNHRFSIGGGIVLVDEEDIAGQRCFFTGVDLPGAPYVADVLPRVRPSEIRSRWTLPEMRPCEQEEYCQWQCVLSPDASTLAFLTANASRAEDPTVMQVIDAMSGAVLFEGSAASVGELDLLGDLLLVNDRIRGVDEGSPATLIDLTSGDATVLVLEGQARFAVSNVVLNSPAVPPTAAAIQLRADGLGVADFGDPVDDVTATIIEVLGPPESDWIAVPPWSEGGSCFSASGGFGCKDYFRSASWGRGGLQLVFSDVHGFGEHPAFVGWSVGPGDTQVRTDEGLLVGSTVAEVEQMYGDEVHWYWDRPYGADFTIGVDLGISGWIEGNVPSDGEGREGFVPDPGSHIEMLWAGAQGTP